MNKLSTSRTQNNQRSELCPFCETEPECVDHFLFRCSKYSEMRNDFYGKISNRDSDFIGLDDNHKLRYILNVECPDKCIGICCNYVQGIYESRLKYLA